MCLNIQSFAVSEPWSFENFSIKENSFSGDISSVNLILAWNELAKSTKLLISFRARPTLKKCHG